MSAETQPEQRRTFSHVRDEWYGKDVLRGLVDAMYISVDDCDFMFEWHDLATEGKKSTSRLGMFEDAWSVFTACPEFFAWLASKHGTNPQPAEVIEGLLSLGFVDETTRAKPESDR
jgi:hypothetical protein